MTSEGEQLNLEYTGAQGYILEQLVVGVNWSIGARLEHWSHWENWSDWKHRSHFGVLESDWSIGVDWSIWSALGVALESYWSA